jgi:hypothetical protein
MGRVNFTNALNYPPWIGRHYGAKEKLRKLIVGRSYYDARYRDKTIEQYITDLTKNKVNDPYFTALEIVLSERNHWKSGLGGLKLDRKKFWNSFCYHQFIQGILADGFSPINKNMWKQGQEFYREVLTSLQPDIVVMVGNDVFNNMPTLGGRTGRTYTWQGINMRTWILTVGNNECQIAEIDSPRGSSFNTEIWKELYHQFISDYKNKHKLSDFSSL